MDLGLTARSKKVSVAGRGAADDARDVERDRDEDFAVKLPYGKISREESLE